MFDHSKDERFDLNSVIQSNMVSDDEPETKPVGGSNVSGPMNLITVKMIEDEMKKDRETERLNLLDEKFGCTLRDRDPSRDFITKEGRKVHHMGDGYTVEVGLTHNEFGDLNDLAIDLNLSMDEVIKKGLELFVDIHILNCFAEVREILDKKQDLENGQNF